MATYIIGGVVLGALILAVYKTIKDRKSGGCGCGCTGCSQASKKTECGCHEAHHDGAA